jgi:hypothetical protein
MTRATIAILAKTPVHKWQQRHHDEDNNASLMTSDEGINLAQQRQRCLCINIGNDSITTMAKMPATINVFTMVPIAQPNFQDACRIGSHAFAALGWAEG